MRLNPADFFLYCSMRVLRALDRRRTDIKDFSPGAVKNILVVSSTAIGDTLLSTPAIRAVRGRYPEAKVIALFNRNNIELFENNPCIDGIIPYYGGYRRFFSTIRELRKHRFDLALIFHGNEPQTTPICYLSGASFIVKLPNTSRFNFLLSNRDPLVSWDDMGHGIEGRLKTASLAGCGIDNKRMELFIDGGSSSRVDGFLRSEGINDAPLVGFQPGASTVSRMWFPERFIELGKRVLKEYPGSVIVVTGSPGEKDLCEAIGKGIGKGVLVTSGRLGLKETAALIKRLKVLVSGDTGPMHMAVALSTPVVALYAVADPERTGPYYDRELHRVIKKERTCDPCVSKKCEYQECMEAITVDEVFEALNEILSKSKLSIGQ